MRKRANPRNWFQNRDRLLSRGMLLGLLLLVACGAQLDVQQIEGIRLPVQQPPKLDAVEVNTSVEESRSTIYDQIDKVVDDPEIVEEVRVAVDDLASRLLPEDWMNWPVVPQATNTAIEIYNRGLALGNNPRAFSKFGDCQNIPSMFMSTFDDSSSYSFGEEHLYLLEAIEWFSGSYARESQSVRSGFNAASVVSPLWADPESCEVGESPLDCEVRIYRPSFALISLETWWEGDPAAYERYVREIIEKTIDYGIVPIITTKADNLEGDHRINATLASLAYEYDIPLWNFWRAVQPLPNNGLWEDGFHLTYAFNQFDNAQSMKAAWPWRNLTALQALDAVWRGVTNS
ncbi:MAG: hypothetical protein IIC78_10770 [Chloroflexi bacterium]|nr:hypothetical protein [Chloroflexota bacterium]